MSADLERYRNWRFGQIVLIWALLLTIPVFWATHVDPGYYFPIYVSIFVAMLYCNGRRHYYRMRVHRQTGVDNTEQGTDNGRS